MGVKFKVNEEFFCSWNFAMAYVLGYWCADGSLEDCKSIRGKYIRVSSIDKNTIIKIKKLLSSEHKIVILPRQKDSNRKTRYLLRIGSARLFESLINLGVFPNKSLSMLFPKVPRKYLSDFVRGYFDGDGCVYIWKQFGKIRKLSIIFTSGSFVFLKELCDILKIELNLKQKKVYNSHRSFQLRYSTEDSIKIFKFMYLKCDEKIYLERKFEVFRGYFKERPWRVDNVVNRVLNGAVVK